jgi:hypothetical protein
MNWQNRQEQPQFRTAMEFPHDASDTEDDSHGSVTSSEVSTSNRRNRFRGPKSTWRNYIKEERLVASSITKMRDQDLSIHLYNAHAMKRRQYDLKQAEKLKPWANKVRSCTIVLNIFMGSGILILAEGTLAGHRCNRRR